MNGRINRRTFLRGAAALAAIGGLPALQRTAIAAAKREYQISLAAWSLHKAVFEGGLKMLDVPRMLRDEFQIDGLEFVNTMMEVPTADYVNAMRRRCAEAEVKPLLIMCDGEGELAHPDPEERARAVRHHLKWVIIARDLGCHSIRVNWRGGDDVGQDEAKLKNLIDYSVETYGKLIEHGREHGINVLIENHGGASSNPDQLARLMKAVNSPHFGTLPDFGNFPDGVDKYDAIDRMMPWAKGVSAKCYDFGPDGNETTIDFARMIEICVDKHGYHGWIGIEFEGKIMTEPEGIKAARDLLIKLRGA